MSKNTKPSQLDASREIVAAESKIRESLEVIPLNVERDLSEDRYRLQKKAIAVATEGLEAIDSIIRSRKGADASDIVERALSGEEVEIPKAARDSDVIAAVKVAISAAEQQRPDLTLENENLLNLFTEITVAKFGDRFTQEETEDWLDSLTEAFTNSDNLLRIVNG